MMQIVAVPRPHWVLSIPHGWQASPVGQKHGRGGGCRRLLASPSHPISSPSQLGFSGALSDNFRTRVASQFGTSSKRKGGCLSATNALPIVKSIPIVGPIVNFLLSPTVLLVIYVFGALRFYRGFERTTYNNALGTKVGLTALWPVLFVVSQTYRQNFKKAVK